MIERLVTAVIHPRPGHPHPLHHYAQMLRRHIVTDLRLPNLPKYLPQTPRALDLIY